MAAQKNPKLRPQRLPKTPVFARVHNERDIAGKGAYDVAFDLAHDVQVNFRGPTGPVAVDAVTSDLLDVALAVFFIERDLRKPAATNRIRKISARLPVRRPEVWRPVRPVLESLLGFMGGHGWSVSFVRSKLAPRSAARTEPEAKEIVSLHSGGLDSTCGLASLRSAAPTVQLTSFYTSQRRLQEEIAADLGFDEPSILRAVWRKKENRRGRGGFAYRSFLFLSIATLVARSFQARRIFQFENGFLAAAIPVSPNYFPTRHAHPRYHRLFAELIAGVGISIPVSNPFRWMTKREAVELFRRELAGVEAVDGDETLRRTQSCWFYHYHQFQSRFVQEKIPLASNEHCGACVPCLVRRAALGDSAYTLDPRSPSPELKDLRNVSYNYDAFLAFCRLVDAHRASPGELRRALLSRGVIVEREAGPWDKLHPLIVRFADEFFETLAPSGEAADRA